MHIDTPLLMMNAITIQYTYLMNVITILTWINTRLTNPAATRDLAIHLAAYAADRSTFDGSFPENAPPKLIKLHMMCWEYNHRHIGKYLGVKLYKIFIWAKYPNYEFLIM